MGNNQELPFRDGEPACRREATFEAGVAIQIKYLNGSPRPLCSTLAGREPKRNDENLGSFYRVLALFVDQG